MEKRETKLNFKPLTEGLGFHPFSDGLPYAPTSPKLGQRSAPQSKLPVSHKATSAASMGTGAVAAGVARPVPQPFPKVSQASAFAHTVPQVRVPTVQKTMAPVQVTAAAPSLATVEEKSVTHYGVKYLAARMAAFTLDTALILMSFFAGISTYLAHFAIPSGREATLQDWAYIVLVLGTIHWALLAFQEVAFGTTIGKRVFGLQLNGSAAAIFLRAFFFPPSVLCLGLGFLPVLIDRQRRCLHDLLVDVQPEWSNP